MSVVFPPASAPLRQMPLCWLDTAYLLPYGQSVPNVWGPRHLRDREQEQAPDARVVEHVLDDEDASSLCRKSGAP